MVSLSRRIDVPLIDIDCLFDELRLFVCTGGALNSLSNEIEIIHICHDMKI